MIGFETKIFVRVFIILQQL